MKAIAGLKVWKPHVLPSDIELPKRN